MSVRQQYNLLYENLLNPISTRLECYLSELCLNVPRIDRIKARAKSPERFARKAEKLKDDGKPKYTDPLAQIQDLVAARIVVFYKSDVDVVSEIIESYFRRIERKAVVEDSPKAFGYEGKHYILAIPDEVLEEGMEEQAPKFFELQIKTLFQHAWGEAEHDLNYKADSELSPLQKKQVAFTAAQAWGADEHFDALFVALKKDDF